jgi:molecular chaperone DnaJ
MVRVNRKMKINIPPGVDNGTQLRISHEGQPGLNGGPAGDLYVVLRVEEHPFFEREGEDLHCVIPINIAQAALGAEVEVPTLEEPDHLKIPEGTQHGARFRLKGKGVPRVNGSGRGDLWVHVEVRVPSKLTKDQKKLLEQLRATLPADNGPAEKGLFEKVKDYFM